MTTSELRVFEATIIPFGPNLGRTVDSIPLRELLPILSTATQVCSEFAEQLLDYLADPVIAQRLEDQLREDWGWGGW